MAGVQIDPDTGLPVFDPSTDPSTTGTTLTTNPLRGFGAGGATPMRGPNPKPPFGFGASSAQPMRGPPPNFPYPDPNSLNPVSQAQGPGAPTNSWFQRPSGTGASLLGDVDSPGGGYGGGARSGPLQYGPGRSPSGWSGPDSGGIGSDANFPTGAPFNGATPNEVRRGNAYGGDPAGTPTQGPSIWDRVKSVFGGAYDNIHDAMPDGSGQAAAPSPDGGGGGGGIGSDANFPLTGSPSAQRGMPWAGNNGGRPYGAGAPAPAGRGAGRAPPLVNLGRGAPGVAAPHPAVAAAAAHAAAMGAQQPDSPFTLVLRPNASAQNGNAYPGSLNYGPRGSGGTPLATALNLSHMFGGGQPAPAAAAPTRAPAPRARVQGPLGKTALKRPAAAPYPVTGSGSPTPIDIQGNRPGPRSPADYGDMTWLHGTQPPF